MEEYDEFLYLELEAYTSIIALICSSLKFNIQSGSIKEKNSGEFYTNEILVLSRDLNKLNLTIRVLSYT